VRIVAPVSSPREVEMLLHHGADELYCGLCTPEWEAHFGCQWWMNRRSPSHANLASWTELEEVVRRAHEREVPVHLALNAPFYTDEGMAYLLRLSEQLARELQIDTLIVSDINLLMLLAREQLPVHLHLSSLGRCFSSHSAEFYRSLGVRRIILPRQLRLAEIERIVGEASRELEFEVFAVNDGCYFEEGFCQTSHSLGPFCLADWKPRVYRSKGTQPAPQEIEGHHREQREYLWYQNNCGSSFQGDGLPNGPCSLCWFGHFRDWGVKAVKIVGREASFVRKLGSIQMVKAIMDAVRSAASPEAIARAARALRATPEHCEKGYMCYFRDH
jgi:putative protease